MWYGYPYEDHGDPSVDERWRRTLNRQASAAGEPIVTPIDKFLKASESGNMWDHVHPLNDLYVPEHERRDLIDTVDDLLDDIGANGP